MVLNVHVNTAHIRYIDIIQLPFSGVNRNFKKKAFAKDFTDRWAF